MELWYSLTEFLRDSLSAGECVCFQMFSAVRHAIFRVRRRGVYQGLKLVRAGLVMSGASFSRIKESVVVELYEVVECCGRGFNEFGVDDIRDKVGEADGGKAAKGALSCRRCWGRFKVERSEDGEVVGGREWGARD